MDVVFAESSATVAMAPSMVQRLRPAADRRLLTTSSSSPEMKRASAMPSLAPSRTAFESARRPVMSWRAESKAVLPAPVSPVSTVRPGENDIEASWMSAMFVTCSSSSMRTYSSTGPPKNTRETLA